MKRCLVVLAVFLTILPARAARAQEPASTPRAQAPLTLLQINDVYSTVPVDGAGGLARVAAYKQRLAAAGRTPFLVLAGDFLSPSVASSIFRGEQMIAALNAAGLDLATIGNHEFDFGDDLLIQRMQEARWQWVISNVTDTRTGKPIGGAAPYLVRAFGPLKVGFIGLCLATSEISREKLTHTRLDEPLAAAAKYLPALKREGAQVIVAVTHLSFADDRALVARFPQIDLVIGGHEHYPITTTEGRALISKAGSDARWVARIDVNRRREEGIKEGIVERFYELVPMTSELPDEPRTAAVVETFERRLGTELDVVVGETRTPLDAEETRLRANETNIGNLFADAMREETGAEIAIMNAGSIRGNRIYPIGPLSRRTVIAMHPFGNTVCKVSVTGRTLVEALNSGVSKLPATAGQFPQVSGVTFKVDAGAPPGQRVRDVQVNSRPLDPAKSYDLALPDYMLKGGDDYTMFSGARVLVDAESGSLLVTTLEKYITSHGTVAPQIEGRIAIGR